jgi:CheY-like chemotaxis protein
MALHSHTVLVVEDDPFIRLALTDCLEDEGYLVLEAANVLEAIAVLGRQGKIDALVTDIDMPGSLNGLDLAQLLRGCDSEVAIIVTSGGHIVADEDLPIAGRFLRKPYRMEDMFSVLKNMIRATAPDVDFRQAV